MISIDQGHYQDVDLSGVQLLVTFNMRNWSRNVVKEFEAVRRRLGLGQQGGGGGGFGGNTENVRGRIGQLKGQIMQSTATPTTTQMMQGRAAIKPVPK